LKVILFCNCCCCVCCCCCFVIVDDVLDETTVIENQFLDVVVDVFVDGVVLNKNQF
jgi:hypothetical protein